MMVNDASPSPSFRVIDFSTHLSGPLASYLLREFGAEVIKVEAPGHGDGLRALKPDIAGTGKYHAGLNAGARSVVLDARSDLWRPAVEGLVRSADVVIVGARPASARARGIDFDQVRTLNANIVYCAISGFGEAGPWAGNAAHGLNPDAWAGIVPMTQEAGYPAPPADYLSHGTPLAGVFAALGIMAALFRRQPGIAQYVTTSLWGAAMWWNWRDANLQLNIGEGREGYATLGARYASYTTADGRAVMVCPIERKFWVAFCEAIGLDESLAQRGRWRETHVDYGWDDERPLIAERIAARSLDHWTGIFARADIPFAPVLTAGEALSSEQAIAMQVTRRFAMDGAEVEVMASPVRIGGEAGAVTPSAMTGPPQLGADTEAILSELGIALSGDA